MISSKEFESEYSISKEIMSELSEARAMFGYENEDGSIYTAYVRFGGEVKKLGKTLQEMVIGKPDDYKNLVRLSEYGSNFGYFNDWNNYVLFDDYEEEEYEFICSCGSKNIEECICDPYKNEEGTNNDEYLTIVFKNRTEFLNYAKEQCEDAVYLLTTKGELICRSIEGITFDSKDPYGEETNWLSIKEALMLF
jgi:hypothetical protein